ncbi:MAG: DUF1499 domain-containing protein [Pseudomonadota bacterium]
MCFDLAPNALTSPPMTWSANAFLLAALVLGGLLIVFRLPPLDPARWHVSPEAAPDPGGSGLRLLQPDAPVVAAPAADALARFDALVLGTPRTRHLAGSTEEGRITYVTRSFVFGFPDLTTVEAQSVAEGTALTLVARARFGQSDLGVNAARVSGWIKALQSVEE